LLNEFIYIVNPRLYETGLKTDGLF